MFKSNTTSNTGKPLSFKPKRAKLAELTHLKEGVVSSHDGTKIWYRSMGKGTPIIFCNGLGCSHFYFKHLGEYFKNKNQIVMFDWRAHGRSERPKDTDNMTVEDLTQDLKAVMDHLNIKKAILVGHSMGVQILYNFYAHHSKRVLALIPCFGTFGRPMDTFYNMSLAKYAFEWIYVFNHLFPKTAAKLGILAAKNPLWFQMGSLFKMMNPGLVDKNILKEYIDHFTSVDPVLLTKLMRSMQEHSAEDDLKKVKVPTLIFAADQDKFTPVWISKKTHHLIPKSELMVIKNASHVALAEQPELINLRIEKFLQERL
jgi:pimeloyl-ACP methyl ester carboxylesterase